MIAQGWVAIRRDETGEWIDTSTWSPLWDMAVDRARAMEKGLEGWAAANPVVRIARANMVVEEAEG